MSTLALCSPTGGLALYSYTTTNPHLPLTLTASSPAPCSLLSWSTDSTKLLTVQGEKLQLWDKDGCRLPALARTDSEAHLAIATAAFINSTALVLTCTGSTTIHHYSLTTSPPSYLGSLPPASSHPSGSSLLCLATNTDASLLASSSSSSSLAIHNLSTSSSTSLHFKPTSQRLVALAFSPTRRTLLAAASSLGVVHLFDTSRPSAPLRTIPLSAPGAFAAAVTCLTFSPVGPLLLACNREGKLGLIDTEKMKLVLEHEVGTEVAEGGMTLAADGRTLVFAPTGGKGGVKVLDVKTRKEVKEVRLPGGGGGVGAKVAFMPAASKAKKTTAEPSKKAASAVLADSINRMRTAHKSIAPEAPVAKKSHLAGLGAEEGETFSPLQFGGKGRTVDLDLSPRHEQELELPPSREAFAESISREARTSTIRAASSSSSRSQSSTSRPSSSLSHARSTSSNSQLSHDRPSSSQSHHSTRERDNRVPTPSSANTTMRSNETIGGQVARRLPSVSKEGGSAWQSRFAEEDEENGGSGENTPIALGKKSKGKGKRVGFGGAAVEEERAPSPVEQGGREEDVAEERWAYQEEKLDGSSSRAGGEARTEPASGADLLKSAVRDVMEEFQTRSSRDVQNLHLEMMRQAFTQKAEMKDLLVQYLGGELQTLREENRRLKEENARLRRGY